MIKKGNSSFDVQNNTLKWVKYCLSWWKSSEHF